MAVLFLRLDVISDFPTNCEISKFLKSKRELVNFILCAKKNNLKLPKDVWRKIAITLCWGVVLQTKMEGISIIDYYKFWMSHRVTRIYNPFIYNQFDDTCSALALLIMYNSKSFSDFDFGHPLRELLNEKSATAMCRCKSLNVVKIGNSLDKARVYSCNIPRNGEILVGIVDNPNIYDPQIIVSDNAGDKIYPIDMSENIMPRTMCISLSVTEHVKSFPLLTAATIRPLNTFIGGGDLFDNRIVLRFTAKKKLII